MILLFLLFMFFGIPVLLGAAIWWYVVYSNHVPHVPAEQSTDYFWIDDDYGQV